MITHVYADGGVLQKNPSPLGGTWAWCHTTGTYSAGWARKIGDWGYFTPSLFDQPHVTNNVAEMYAVLLGLEALPDGWSGTVCSDSSVTLERLRTWTDPPGVAVALRGVPPRLQQQMWAQVRRLDWQNVRFLQLAGHPTRSQLRDGTNSSGVPVSIHQVWCDSHCNVAAERYRDDQHPTYETVRAVDMAVLEQMVGPHGGFVSGPLPTIPTTVVRRSLQEMSFMARYARAARPRYILGTRIGGSAESTLVTGS